MRRIDAAPGVITTLAGDGSGKFSGDGGPAAQPDWRNRTAWRWIAIIAGCSSPTSPIIGCASSISLSGIIDTFAGTGEARHDGDGGTATAAGVFGARAVALAPDGSLYIMERQGSSMRRVRDGIIETVAGTGARGYAGDGHDARHAVFNAPKEMAVDPDGNVFVVDTENHAIRLIDAHSWIVTTIAGTGRSRARRRWRPGAAGRPGATARRRRGTGWCGLYRRFGKPPRAQAGTPSLSGSATVLAVHP